MFHVKHDVVVVGGGHAGCEAAAAAARRGATVALVTFDPALIGAMSCNPAIGGIGKGHLVREVDALGGLIGRAADASAIHHRMLNRSRGRAVWGPRVQADRALFAAAVQREIGSTGIDVVAGEAVALKLKGGRATAVVLADGSELPSKAVVIATGTFLEARLFIGRTATPGGRYGERAAVPLAAQLRELAPSRRLKTGTPPRLDGRTIDWARLDWQDSDDEPWSMGQEAPPVRQPQILCGITRTTDETHDLIRAAGDESPLYAGDIAGVGPRYCPSIEDKVRRFGDRDGHQIFLEPEGLGTPLVYPNGLSTSLPLDIQEALIRSIPGLASASIVQPGYAVEYEMLDPRYLDRTLAQREVGNLFLAGQINGTTGYEEAAGQGLVAGLNAAAVACDLAPVHFDRRDSYVGVMVDDLTLQGVSEPYRMLTARAEHRLYLRSDNAESRLFATALAADCLPAERLARAIWRVERRAALAAGTDPLPGDEELAAEVAETLHYAPYVERERAQAARTNAGLNIGFDPDFDFGAIAGLSHEMRERLSAARPATIAEAQRVAGISPAAITALLVAARKAA